jgi:hypothetical protein
MYHMVCGAEFAGQPIGSTAPQHNVSVPDRLKTKVAQVVGGTTTYNAVHSEPQLTSVRVPKGLVIGGMKLEEKRCLQRIALESTDHLSFNVAISTADVT